MKKNILISLLFIAMVVSYNYSQNSLEGVVLDETTGSSIENASVYFPLLEKGSITNENGSYAVSKLPLGNHKIIISYIGYATYATEILIKEGKNNLNVLLQPSAIEIEEVIVSTPFHKLQSENVMKVERKSIAELKTNGAVTLSEGVANIAGVSSVSTGVSIGKPVIRGLSSNRVLVYTQGLRLENQQFGDEHGLGINDAGIESVEVIKGPASLLYGSDALGGVLYLNPERFANNNDTEGDFNTYYYSNTEGYQINAGIKTSGEHFKFLLRGAHASHTDYKAGNNLLVTNSRFNEYDFKSGVAYQLSNFKTELRYNYNNSELGIPEEVGIQTRRRSPDLPFQEINNHILSSKTSFYFKNSSLDITLGYIFNDRKEFEEHEEEVGLPEEPEEGPALHMKLNTYSYNFQYNLPKWGGLETILGLQGMLQENSNFGEEILIPDATTKDIGVLLTTHYHLNKNDFQFGIRYDNRNVDSQQQGLVGDEDFIAALDRNFSSFNISLGYKTNISDNLVARLNMATGFRAPNLSELTSNGVHEGTNRFEIGNPNLDNEQNFQIDISLEYKNEHIEIYANGFYNKVNDFIFLFPNGNFIDDDPVFLYRQEDAKLYGGEFGFHLHPHPLDWLHLESSYETVIGKQDNGNNLPLIPANTLTNTFRVEFNNINKFKNNYAFITLINVFRQGKASVFETPTSGYTLLNVGMGSSLPFFNNNLKIQLSANNLLDKTYIAHLSRLKTDNVPNIGRNISIGLTLGF
ncbi:TonB-dependent receptor [Leptobacterium sp. I13]|uniref:TonB-dependent receptor n=1 Tax=Leptobacterium meishanense TaxID=3128904 RepID=UPI0030EB8E9C